MNRQPAPAGAHGSDSRWRRLRQLTIGVYERFVGDHVTLTAAGVAFFGFVALIPLIIAGVSLYGLVADPDQVSDLIARLGPGVPDAVTKLIEQQLNSVASASSGALSVGLAAGVLVALWTASSGIFHLAEALNIAHDVSDDRPFWRKRGHAVALTLALLAVLGLITIVLSFSATAFSGPASVAVRIGGWLGAAAIITVALSVFYRVGPERSKPPRRWISSGAGFAVAATVIASLGFSVYVSRFGSYNETYGSLGAIVVTLLWMYICSIVIIVGAEINAELERPRDAKRSFGTER